MTDADAGAHERRATESRRLPAAMADALTAFARCGPFRSAEGHELLFAQNPFHRPVRPNDLSFVDFSRALDASRVSELSGLMGQRLLANANELDVAFLPSAPLSEQAARDRAHFHDPDTATQAARLRPWLEDYLFGWAAADAAPAALASWLPGAIDDCIDGAGAALEAATAGSDAAALARFTLVQLTGPGFSRELALGRWACVDWSGRVGGWVDARALEARRAQATLRRAATAAALLPTPHANWQFYLPTWLGTSNYLQACLRDPRRFDEALGAVLFDRACWAAIGPAWAAQLGRSLAIDLDEDSFAPCAGSDGPLLQRTLDAIDARRAAGGAAASLDAARGAAAMHALWRAAMQELQTQCTWAGAIDQARALAQRYMDAIGAATHPVDLESYDEPSSERSTTHVHDTDRLLVIDSGEMDFWPCFGTPLHLRPGDMLYVPRHRLHGSVVTSARCRYHQPVIDARLRQACRAD